MSTFNFQVNFDANNNFQNVNANGKTFTLAEWQAQFKSLNPQQNVGSNTSDFRKATSSGSASNNSNNTSNASTSNNSSGQPPQ